MIRPKSKNRDKEGGFLSNDFLNKKIWKLDVAQVIVWSEILAYTVVFSLFTISKHRAFHSYAWDLGIFNQAFWTTVNLGRVFYYTCELHFVKGGSFFGIHFSPILYSLVPLYALFPGPETLLIIQSFIVGVAAYPLYLIGKKVIDKRYAILFSLFYLINPVVHGINSYDFHVQIFFPFLIFLSYYFYVSKKWTSHLLSLLLVLMVQEQAVYIVFFYGLHEIIEKRQLIYDSLTRGSMPSLEGLTPFVIIILSFLWFYVSSTVIHHYNPQLPDELKSVQHFAILGAPEPGQIPFYILRNPLSVLSALSFDWYEKLSYLLYLLAPFLFASLFKPGILLPTVPWFAISFLSNYAPYYRLGFQYPAYAIPFIFVSSLFGLRELTKHNLSENFSTLRNLLTLIIVINIAYAFSFSPLSPLMRGNYPSPSYQKFSRTEHVEKLNDVLELIPGDSSVLTQDNLFPHLSSNEKAYVLFPPIQGENPFYKETLNYLMNLNTDYIFIDLETDPHSSASVAFKIPNNYTYGLVAYIDNIYLFKANYTGEPEIYENIHRKYDYDDLTLKNAKVVKDPTSTSGKVVVYDYKTESDTVWYGPYDTLSSGTYKVTFRLKSRGDSSSAFICVDVHTGGRVLNSTTLDRETIPEPNDWFLCDLVFSLPEFATDVEFRGFNDGRPTDICLDYIDLRQLSLDENLLLTKLIHEYYTLLLGRTPGTQELDHWMDRLRSGGSKADLVKALLSSKEQKEKWEDRIFAASLHLQLLGESLDHEQIETLTESGGLWEELLQGWMNGTGWDTALGGLDNRRFVEKLYRNLLEREPDEEGLEAWTQTLDSEESTRAQVITKFYEGEEHMQRMEAERIVYKLYIGLLGRAPGRLDLEYWAGRVRSGASERDIISEFIYTYGL